MSDQYETNGGDDDDNTGDEERVVEWEVGLPSVDDLTPLSQHLIPPELASAFSISPEPCRTLIDVNRASQSTFSTLRGGGGGGGCGGEVLALSSNNFKSFNEDRTTTTDPMVVEAVEEENIWAVGPDRDGLGSESRKLRKIMKSEEADSALRTENSPEDPSSAARTLKRPRLVWTPQLHKRFVDVVGHLGIKNAVPKTIMQLMNVEGLTRENVASHLQKYRLYLKRMQGLSNEGPSSSDQLFASTPVPQSLHESGGGGGGGSANGGGGGGGGSGWNGAAHGNGHLGVPIPVPYHPGTGAMLPMQVYGHMGMQMGNHHHPHQPPPPPPPPPHHHHHPNGFDGSVPYNMLQQRDWRRNTYSYHPHHVAPNDNM